MQRFIFTRKTTNTIAPFVDIEKGIGGGEDGKTTENDNKKIKSKYYNENCFKFKSKNFLKIFRGENFLKINGKICG